MSNQNVWLIPLLLPAAILGVSCGDDPGAPENQHPTATIFAPLDGSTFVEGEAISFIGTADDHEDGLLGGAQLVWRSSLDGQIGTGTTFSRDDLSLGTHEITLTASDGNGLSGDTATSTTIIFNDPPDAVISSPVHGSMSGVGTSIEFSGSAADPEDGVLTGGNLVWTSDIDGILGTGNHLIRNDLTVGDHRIRLIATDKLGRADTARILTTLRSVRLADSIRVFPHIVVVRQNATTSPFIQPFSGNEPVYDSTLSVVSRDPSVASVDFDLCCGASVGFVSVGVTDIVISTAEVADSIRIGAIRYGGFVVHVSREDEEFISEASPAEIVRLGLRILRRDVIDDLAAVEGTVLWDPSVLSYQGSTVLEPGWTWTATPVGSAELTFEAFSSDGKQEEFVLAELEFAVVGESGDSSPLDVRIDSAAAGDGTTISDWVSAMDGALEVR